MGYSLYTELVNNKVSKTDAEHFCKILEGIPIGPGELIRSKYGFEYRSDDVYEKYGVRRTNCSLNNLGEITYIGGYHIGRGFYKTNFAFYSTGDYTICSYSRKHRELFDKNDELYIITNHPNVFDESATQDTDKVPRAYHFSKKAVDKLQELTKNSNDYFNTLCVLDIELFAKYGLRPDGIYPLPSNVDVYKFVGNLVADKDLEKRAAQVRS